MTTTRVLANQHRWTCDECGFSRSDYGPDAVLLIQINHRCEEGEMTILETAWAQLDEQVEEIVKIGSDPDSKINPTIANELERAKARARGKAEILVLLMTPYFTTPEQIAAEAQARYAAARRGERRETPGLAVVWQPGLTGPDPGGPGSS